MTDESNHSLQEIKVLFVDDEPGVLFAVRDYLTIVHQYSVDICESARSVLESFDIDSYECLILDYEMPEINGIVFLKQIRKNHPGIPVIILTGKSREEIAIEAVNSGVDYYLQKGSSPDSFFRELAYDIEKVVRRFRAEKALLESEKRYRVVVEDQTEFICRMNWKGIIRFVNHAFSSYLSRPEESIIGTSFFDIYPKAKKDLLSLPKTASGNTIIHIELPQTGPDGSIRWHQWSIRSIHDPDSDEPVDIQAVGHDITERVEIEHQIAAQRDLGLALALCSSVESVIEKCMNTALKISGMENGVVYLKDRDTGLFRIFHESGPLKLDLKKFSELWQQEKIWFVTIMEGGALYFGQDDLKKVEGPFLSAAIIPIQRYDDVIGWFVLGSDLLSLVPVVCRKTLETITSQIGNVIARIEAEEALRDALLESEQRYMQLSESSHDAIAILSGFQVIHLNPAAIRLFGITSPDEFMQKPILQYIHPDSVSGVEEMINECLTSQSPVSCETSLSGRKGNTLYAELIAVPISQSGECGVLLIIRDMTEQKLQARAIAESEQRFREMTDLLPEPVFETDLSGNIAFCNRSASEMFGIGEGDLSTGFSLKKLIISEDYPRLDEMIQEIRLEGKARSGEYMVDYPPGVQRPILLSLASIQRDEGYAGMRGVMFDITDIKRYENQLKLTIEEKDVLFREVHHRVKNNMQIISSLLQLQEEYVEDDQVLAALQDCQQRITSMALVHETLYRTESLSGLPFGEYLFHLSNEVREGFATVRDISIQINVGDISLSLDTAVTLGLILNELMVNSMKYAFTGRGTGTIRITMTGSDGDYTLDYADDGSGLPAGFDIERSTTLGMRLIRVLARQMRGSVHIPLNTGEGMKFSISFSESGKDKAHHGN